MGESSNLNKRYEKERELNERLSEELELLKQEKERMNTYALAGKGAVGQYTYCYQYNDKWWW